MWRAVDSLQVLDLSFHCSGCEEPIGVISLAKHLICWTVSLAPTLKLYVCIYFITEYTVFLSFPHPTQPLQLFLLPPLKFKTLSFGRLQEPCSLSQYVRSPREKTLFLSKPLGVRVMSNSLSTSEFCIGYLQDNGTWALASGSTEEVSSDPLTSYQARLSSSITTPPLVLVLLCLRWPRWHWLHGRGLCNHDNLVQPDRNVQGRKAAGGPHGRWRGQWRRPSQSGQDPRRGRVWFAEGRAAYFWRGEP